MSGGRRRRAASDRSSRDVPRQRRSGRETVDGALSDDVLLRRMREGDSSAYETLYRRHASAVRRYAATCCRDTHTAEDLTNEVFARTLQAVRSGAGPVTSVRAYLLTSVRRVAAAWVRTAKRERLVEDFAVFAEAVSGASAASEEDTLSPGADVRAMHEADRTLVVQAFRSLPEKYRTVLWHTAVEQESPKQVAPLLGLSGNATAVLAHRAREKLKQAYLQAHVQRAVEAGGECARHADRLGAYARGGLRMRAERGLRKHLESCASCRTAAAEVGDLNAQIRLLVPVAFLGWFGSAGGAKLLGLVAGSGAAAGTGTAAAGGAGAAAEGASTPVKIGIAAGVATAAGVAVAFALIGADAPQSAPRAAPSSAPAAPEPQPTREPEPSEPSEQPPAVPPPAPKPTARQAAEPEPTVPSSPAPVRPAPATPTPDASPSSEPPPPAPTREFRLDALSWDVRRPGTAGGPPTIRTEDSSWLWQRYGAVRTGGRTFRSGVTVSARSSVTVDLNRTCTAYDGWAGIDALTVGDRSVRFTVLGDGAALWRSPVVGSGDRPVAVHVPLAGVETVRLVVEQAEARDGGAVGGPAGGALGGATTLADWADAAFRCR
ncbi:sigma-70 family RNA polymerase sigma factor [Streptomyces sp. TR06-5]|uniref:sigma-70 family RNA polymerase sigma factor n=1 Tax=unclassified Streptomyces TaxID=2593676 RepID=UPI0039A02B3D